MLLLRPILDTNVLVSAALNPKGLQQPVFRFAISRSAYLYVSRPILAECADAARADYLVTGNLKHLPPTWKKTRIVSPREFLNLIAPHLNS